MKWNRIVALSITAVCLSWTFLAVADVPVESNSQRIRELHSQKVELLQDILDRYEFGYSKGSAVLEEMLAAEHELLKAKLEFPKSREDSIELHKQLLQNRTRLVDVRNGANEMGDIATVAVLAARVEQLDAEIDLEQARTADLDR